MLEAFEGSCFARSRTSFIRGETCDGVDMMERIGDQVAVGRYEGNTNNERSQQIKDESVVDEQAGRESGSLKLAAAGSPPA